ncbi:hypothetical protein AK812_SmicGene9270 [Symbiodinium microadriaticum]|uniref:Uncharacterized protein n=1 Tax=Symbiodinium microadriaticum TaxID=2951 RepID=A0A1Q9EIV0_SYMMI|nr:hypothetical protein AK812_SmicGene9270 [Symbiodinium microadriaticum]
MIHCFLSTCTLATSNGTDKDGEGGTTPAAGMDGWILGMVVYNAGELTLGFAFSVDIGLVFFSKFFIRWGGTPSRVLFL